MNSDQLCQWGEHIAAAWFIRQGGSVFFPRSSHHKGYDFISHVNDDIKKVQVKAGGGHRFGIPRTNAGKVSPENFDLLFVVHSDGYARLYPNDDFIQDTMFRDEYNGGTHKYTITL